MIAPSPYGPRAARPALLPPTWPPFDPETGEFDLTDEAGPPDGFFVDPDIAMRMAEATAVTKELSPAEAWRDSNRKRSQFTRAQWDLDVRRRAYEEAQAFSFENPAEGSEPVFARLSPEDTGKVSRFTGETGLQVDFPPEYGGYFAAVRDPMEDREIGVVPGPMVVALADKVTNADTADANSRPRESSAEPDDGDGRLSRSPSSGELSTTILYLTPGLGNILSARDAYESWGKAIEAARREDWDAFIEHGGMGLLNTLGAVGGPFSAPLIRLVKLGVRKLVRATPKVREAAAAHSLHRAKKHADTPYPGVPVQKAVGRAFRKLTDEQKKTLRGLFPSAVGRAGERHAVRLLEDAGQTVTTNASKTAARVDMGGRTVKRRYDALIEEVQRDFVVDAFRVFRPYTRTAAVEVKVGGSRLGRQKKIDRAMEADGSFAQEAGHFRFRIKDIPEADFEHAVRELFAKHVSSGKFSQKEVDRIVGGFKKLRRGHGNWLTGELFIGMSARAIASRYAADEEERRRKAGESWRRNAEYHGEAMSQLMTGA